MANTSSAKHCDLEGESLTRRAHEIPFAPGERLMHGDKMRASRSLDDVGLAEPLRVGANFMLGHGGERIHFVGKPANDGDLRNKVHKGKKRGAPGLHEHHTAIFSQDALHFGKSLV